jgi:membrane protein DedA with SNARE-associated domain
VFVFVLLVLADLLGDSIYYYLGATGGKTIIKKYGHKFKMPQERMERIEKSFQNHGWKILAFGKTQPYGALILILAGAAKYNYKKFFIYNATATIPKTLVFFMIGYIFGYGAVNNYIGYAGFASVLLAVLLALAYFFLIKKFRSQKNLL